MERLGKYEIVGRIGVGGFGVVYKAVDPFIKRPVAIKTCSAEDVETRERFLREANIAGNLQHRNIVTIFEFGYHEETPYLVQEFLSGEDLDHKIKRGDAVPVATKISWLVEVARGLAYAHSSGVVHRDIKPANVRVLDDGHVKILDFGIAKLAQGESDLTQAGVTLGTASYLAPEQIRGEPVDARTDVFSFGVLAYELLTYERPFRAQEISTLFYKLLNEPPPPITPRAPGAPPELVLLVERCLAKDPAARFSPTSELLRALERLQPHPISTGIVPRPPLRADATAPAVAEAKTAVMPPRPRSFAADATLELAHVELRSSASDAVPESRGMAAAGRPLARWALLAGGGLAAGALVLGWLALAPPGGETPPAVAVAPAAAAPPVAAPAASAPAVMPQRPAPPATQPAAPAPQPERRPDPPSPAAPKRARLVVGPAWDPTMTVEVAGRRLRLDREQRLEVPAGVTLLRFSLVRPEYSAEEPLRLELRPGASERISIPIEQPGRLTVQPHLAAPPGHVRIDGQPRGLSPVRGAWVPPGSHFLEIYLAASDAEPAWSRSLEIRSGVETIVTFDLDGRVETLVRERPVQTP
ncbi:MAG TPA: serine/threonine-protein kinase [Thermoanaerobaculia bacterium]